MTMRPANFHADSPAAPPITQAGANTAAWVAALDQCEIPVLAGTDAALADLRVHPDAVDAHLLAETLAGDPLFTLKLLRHVALLDRGRGRDHADADTGCKTATEALVMLGITPFFRHFGPQPTVEPPWGQVPRARLGLQLALHRAQRVAALAQGFAVQRQDYNAVLIHGLGLLHNFAELLLWAQVPSLALTLASGMANPGPGSAAAQQALLNTTLADLQQALVGAWRLPKLLAQLAGDIDHDPAPAETTLRTVRLAQRLARHDTQDWHDPALLADVRLVDARLADARFDAAAQAGAVLADVDALAQWLNLGRPPTLRLLQSL